MADNIDVTPGTGKTVSADEIAGVLHQRVKVTLGSDGINDGDVSSANPMPISAASLPLPSGAATEAKQDTGNASLSSIDTKLTSPIIVTANAGTNLNTSLLALDSTVAKDSSLTTINSSINTLLKPANTLAAVTTLGSITSALPTGTNSIGQVTANQSTAANLNATVVGTGTFDTQAAQSGTWNITNVSGTVSLPTGASTSAKQPALGVAGTASADVITVQGIASMTALKVDGSAVTQPVSGTVTANAGTNLNTSALALESGGNLATIKTNTDNLALAQASTTSGQKGNLPLGAVTTSAPSYTTAQ